MRGITLGVFSIQTIYDVDFQTNVLDVAQTNGIPIPPLVVRNRLNTLMIGKKNIGMYQLNDTLSNFALGISGYEMFRMIDWKKTGNIYTPYGGLIYNPEGIEGNGTNAYVNTNFNPAIAGINYTLQNAGRGTIVTKTTSDPLSPPNLIDGITTANNVNTLYNLSSNAQRINNGNVLLPSEVDMSGSGFKAINRDFDSILLYNKNSEYSMIQPSTVISNAEQLILSRGDGRCSSIGVSFYFMSESIPYPMSQAFRIIYNQFLSDSGLSPIA